MRSRVLPVLLLIAGCQAGPPKPKVEQATLPAAYSEDAGTASLTTGSVRQSTWWTSFGDPKMDEIAQRGLAGNIDMARARARLAAADAAVTAARADAFPSLTLGMSDVTKRETGKMKSIDGTVRTSGALLSTAWVVDLFGQVRSQTDAAKGQRDAALADTEVVRLALLSQILSAYVDARYYQERRQIAVATRELRRRNLDLTQTMRASAVASEIDVEQANALLDSVEAEIPLYETGFRKAANRIATLTGQPAGTLYDELGATAGQPQPRWHADVGIPADLTRRRPDIRRAEADLASAMAEIGVAWSQLFPTLTLSGSISPSYVSTSLASGSLNTWSFGPTLRLPIFEGGRLRANVKAAVATAEEKQLAWKSTVLEAVEQVENALTAYTREAKSLKARRDRVHRAERALSLLKASYSEGVASQFELMDADRSLYEARTLVADSRHDLALNFIALQIAAGFGVPGNEAGGS